MIHAADAVAEAENFGCRVSGVTPGSSRLEIAPASVARLKVVEDSIRRLDRRQGRRKAKSIDTLDTYDTWRKMFPRPWVSTEFSTPA
jgi:hypothetical protein